MSRRGLSYKSAGVDIAEGDKATALIKKLVRQTFNRQVLSEVGSFGGFYSAKFANYRNPVLISSADGVGTKLKLATMTGIHDTVGQDLVNHCVNDILVHGARPLFFLDYFATGKLDARVVAAVVAGLAKACRDNGCALIGGETAEMPGFYLPGEYDLAGFVVGVAGRAKIIDGSKIRQGDVVLGLPSTGLHTNGYSLARRLFFDKLKLKPSDYRKELGSTVAKALMAVHRSYLKQIMALIDAVEIHGLAHITGGGIPGNLVRILPRGLRAEIDKSAWTRPTIFTFIQTQGRVAEDVMFETFNMGLGMLVVLPSRAVGKARRILQRHRLLPQLVGEIVAGKREVRIG